MDHGETRIRRSIYSGRLCNRIESFPHVEPKFENQGIVQVSFNIQCNECVMTVYTVVYDM